jgi:hypothetical protein
MRDPPSIRSIGDLVVGSEKISGTRRFRTKGSRKSLSRRSFCIPVMSGSRVIRNVAGQLGSHGNMPWMFPSPLEALLLVMNDNVLCRQKRCFRPPREFRSRVHFISHTGMCLPQHWEAVDGAASYASPERKTCASQSSRRRHRP